MTTCGLRKKNGLLFFAISLLSLLVACTTREEEATRPGAPSPSGMDSTAFALTSAVADTPARSDAVEVTIGQSAYQIGETVHYTVTNYAQSSVWYLTGGCFIPHIVRFEDEREIGLVTYVLTDEIPSKELPAGESLSCRWNQRVFWNPEGEGDERFNITTSSHRVPSGRYQFRFRYAFEEEHIHSRVLSITAESQVFTIE